MPSQAERLSGELVCPYCGYKFVLTWRVYLSMVPRCPRCHEKPATKWGKLYTIWQVANVLMALIAGVVTGLVTYAPNAHGNDVLAAQLVGVFLLLWLPPFIFIDWRLRRRTHFLVKRETKAKPDLSPGSSSDR
jgi:hypothetical protein